MSPLSLKRSRGRPGHSATNCLPRSRGQALVELALVVPVLMLILLVTVDFGRLFFTYIQVNNAAREGAAYGSLNPTSAGITTTAQKEINAQGQRGENSLSVSAMCAGPTGTPLTSCASAPGGSGTGNTITVAVSENFSFLTPLINGAFGNNFKIGASATAAVTVLAAGGTGSVPTCTTAPTPSFTITPAGMTVNLDASASTPTSGTCAISGYLWDMGDGADPFPPVVGKTTSYTYTTAGTYVVKLTVTNPAASPTGALSVTVPAGSCRAPTAVLVVTPTTGNTKNNGGNQGTSFNFDGSTSTNMGDAACTPSWTINFGDGQSVTGTTGSISATHKFDYSLRNTTRSATLTVTNSAGGPTTSTAVSITLN